MHPLMLIGLIAAGVALWLWDEKEGKKLEKRTPDGRHSRSDGASQSTDTGPGETARTPVTVNVNTGAAHESAQHDDDGGDSAGDNLGREQRRSREKPGRPKVKQPSNEPEGEGATDVGES